MDPPIQRLRASPLRQGCHSVRRTRHAMEHAARCLVHRVALPGRRGASGQSTCVGSQRAVRVLTVLTAGPLNHLPRRCRKRRAARSASGTRGCSPIVLRQCSREGCAPKTKHTCRALWSRAITACSRLISAVSASRCRRGRTRSGGRLTLPQRCRFRSVRGNSVCVVHLWHPHRLPPASTSAHAPTSTRARAPSCTLVSRMALGGHRVRHGMLRHVFVTWASRAFSSFSSLRYEPSLESGDRLTTESTQRVARAVLCRADDIVVSKQGSCHEQHGFMPLACLL
jgi:hypothetical protein